MGNNFFKTGNVNDLINWAKATRDTLLKLSSGKITEDTIKYYVKTKLISLQYKSQSELENTYMENKLSSYQTETSTISEAVKNEALDVEAKLFADYTVEVYGPNKDPDKIISDRQAQNTKIILETSTNLSPELIAEEFNPNPIETATKGSNYLGVSEYLDINYINNLERDESQVDPVIPVNFPNSNPDDIAKITESFINRKEYTVFSGYRKNGQEFLDLGKKEFKGWATPNNDGTYGFDKTKTFTKKHPNTELSRKIIEASEKTNLGGTYKFFIEKLHGRYGDKSAYKRNNITDQRDIFGKDNFFNREVFAAYIENFSDDYKVSWSEYDFIGRAEPVPVYKSTKRSITIDFTILTDHSLEQLAAADKLNEQLNRTDLTKEQLLKELLDKHPIHFGSGSYRNDSRSGSQVPSTFFDSPETVWQKITFLSQCCYPYYRADGKMKEQPMIRMRIGDFYDVVCYFESVNVQMNTFDGPLMDFNNSSLGEQPLGYKITLSGSIIHDYEPNSEFYGFYHRKQFDNGGEYKKAYGVDLNKKGDFIRRTGTKNSPFDFSNVSSLKDINLDELDFEDLASNIETFTSSFSSLTSGVNLLEKVKQSKLKKILEAQKNINDSLAKLKELQGFSDFDNLSAKGSEVKSYAEGLNSGIETFMSNSSNNYTDSTTIYSNNPEKEALDKVDNINKNMAEKDISPNKEGLKDNNGVLKEDPAFASKIYQPKTLAEIVYKFKNSKDN